MELVDPEPKARQFKCRECGAMLNFAPGTHALRCPYCDTVNEIEASDASIDELDFQKYLSAEADEARQIEQLVVHCDTCGAETTLDPNLTASTCPFCGHPIVAQAISRRVIRPQSLLPFGLDRRQAADDYRNWLGNLWFAPSALRKAARDQQWRGVYLPAWTYDCDTVTAYTGQRGDDYWDTESYTVTINGRLERRTRQVRKTRWRYASGVVKNSFDDVLVIASQALPSKYLQALEPWDLTSLVPYKDEYLSGFQAESYQIDLANGFGVARQIMDGAIRQTIRADIGGDHQQISSVDTRYFRITFKHTLLPAWISAYRYQDKTYRFVINARTGEVQGERPWSIVKILFAILAALVVAAIIYLVTQR